MDVHSEIIVLLYPVLRSDRLFPIKKHENKRVAPGPFPLLPSSALRETYRGKEKSDGRRKQKKKKKAVCPDQIRIEAF